MTALKTMTIDKIDSPYMLCEKVCTGNYLKGELYIISSSKFIYMPYLFIRFYSLF